LSKITGIEPLVGYDIPIDQMQKHLEKVQSTADAIRQDAQQRKNRDDLLFLIVYCTGSVAALLGSVMKLTAPA